MTRLCSIVCLTLILAAALTGCRPKTPKDQLEKAEELFQAGDIAGAIALTQKVKAMPLDETTYGLATMLLGKYYVYNRQPSDARQQFEEVYKRFGAENPNPVLANQARSAALTLVQSWLVDNQPQKALTLAHETSATLHAPSDFSDNLSMLSVEALVKLKRYDEALQLVDALEQAQKDVNAALYHEERAVGILTEQKKLAEASQRYLDFAKRFPTEYAIDGEMELRAGLVYPEDTKDEAMRATREALLKKAVAEFEKARQRETNVDLQSRLYLRESTAEWALGRHAAAEDMLSSVTQRLAVNPQVRGTALLGLADYKATEGDYDKALEYYRQLQREFPQFSENAQQRIVDVNRKQAEVAILGAKGGATTGTLSLQPASAPGSAPSAPAEPQPPGQP
ncbi:MAG: hypothetical protein NTW86_08685 [Candidatus Sumerlaeota bacterium]|nr:hypothetical protein [Candidatus Sumerlaeota bacterium]